MRQECTNYEILILRNDIQGLLQGMDIVENSLFYHGHLIQEIYIRKKGKDNALNVGISYARNPLVCVIDADFVLEKDAISKAIKAFSK